MRCFDLQDRQGAPWGLTLPCVLCYEQGAPGAPVHMLGGEDSGEVHMHRIPVKKVGLMTHASGCSRLPGCMQHA